MTQLNNALILSAILTLSAALPVVAANSEKDYRDNVQWAKDSIKQNQNKAGYTGFDVNSLCKDATCQQEVANPSESRYYNNPSAMDSAKMQGMSTDGQAQAVTSGFNNGRPTIDENDPAYHTAVGYQNDAYNISHGISSKYHDCEKGLVCEVDSQPRSCTLPTNNPVQCYLTPFVKSTSTQNKEHTFRLSGLPPFSVELPNPDAIITGLRFNGGFLSWGNPISVEISLNKVVIGTVPVKKEAGSCDQNGACPSSVNTSLNASHYQGGAAPMSVNVGTIFGSWGWPFYLSVTNFPITFITTENNVEIGYNNSCGAVRLQQQLRRSPPRVPTSPISMRRR